MISRLLAFYRAIAPQSEPATTAKLIAFKQTSALDGIKAPRVVYAEPMPDCPTRDEAREAYARAEEAAEYRWKMAELAKEREQQQQEQPRLLKYPARTVNS